MKTLNKKSESVHIEFDKPGAVYEFKLKIDLSTNFKNPGCPGNMNTKLELIRKRGSYKPTDRIFSSKKSSGYVQPIKNQKGYALELWSGIDDKSLLFEMPSKQAIGQFCGLGELKRTRDAIIITHFEDSYHLFVFRGKFEEAERLLKLSAERPFLFSLWESSFIEAKS